MFNIFSSFRVYKNPKLAAIVFFGLSSGFPLLLIGSTLDRWLIEGGISKTGVGLFSAVAVPYTLKFLWAPFFDYVRLPFFANWIGHRKSWTLLIQILLMGSLIMLGKSNPADNIWMTALFALMVGFFSASQDIVLESFRIESLENFEQAAGGASITLGYRVGMIAAGAGALYLAEIMPWSTVYLIMSCITIIGMATVLLSEEPAAYIKEEKEVGDNFFTTLTKRIALPFRDFVQKPFWGWLIAVMITYKIGEVLLGKMAMPFYTELGFSKSEIATVSKLYGVLATIAGGLIGGALASRFNILLSLLICGILQMVTNLFYVQLFYAGYDMNMYILAAIADSVTAGMAAACIVALISQLCRKGIAATQYALFSSMTAFAHKYFGMLSGYMADNMRWDTYFYVTILACIPGLIIIMILMKKDRRVKSLV